VFSSALRRLQDKTQVFPLAGNDYVRTRLTHSLEVASVGRSLGVMVGADVIRRYRLADVHPQDFGAIVAAACLAHDIGNPPFGHAGEDAIRLWFATSPTAQAVLAQLKPAECADFLCFDGNAQGFRLLARLQNPANDGGLQLTCATLGTFSKYPCAALLAQPAPAGIAFRKHGFFQDDSELFRAVAETLGLRAASADHSAWRRHPLAYLVEAADDICYRIIDIEDAFRLRRLSYDEAQDLLRPLVDERDVARLANIRRPQERIEFLRAKAIGVMIEQVHSCFMGFEEALLAGEFDAELLDHIPSASELQALKEHAVEKVYMAPEIAEIGAAGFEVLAGLLEAFVAAVNDCAERGPRASGKSRMLVQLVPEQFIGARHAPHAEPYRRVLGVTDFVAGMTDSYAVNLFKKITGISLPSGVRG
jgi:dGTPase